jgi:hypothetical protein
MGAEVEHNTDPATGICHVTGVCRSQPDPHAGLTAAVEVDPATGLNHTIDDPLGALQRQVARLMELSDRHERQLAEASARHERQLAELRADQDANIRALERRFHEAWPGPVDRDCAPGLPRSSASVTNEAAVTDTILSLASNASEETGMKQATRSRSHSVIASAFMMLDGTGANDEPLDSVLSDSMWDACLLLGRKDAGVGNAVMIWSLGIFLLNVLIQTTITAIVVKKMANDPKIDGGTVADLRDFRTNIAHDLNNLDLSRACPSLRGCATTSPAFSSRSRRATL